MQRFLIFLLASAVFYNGQVLGQNTGISEAGITLDGVVYNEQSLPGLNNKTLIKATDQKLNLTAALVKTFKAINKSNVCKAFLFYRIYKEGSTPGVFNEISCNLSRDITGDNPALQFQEWQNNSLNTNLIAGLELGTYSLEFYFAADGLEGSATGCSNHASIFLKNGTAAFKSSIVITGPLNIQFTLFNVKSNNEKVFVDWQVDPTSTFEYFILEKSNNGVAWSGIGTFFAGSASYTYTDPEPFIGITFYRVKAAGFGKTYYSITKRIYVGNIDNSVTVYPNPVFRNLRFQMTAMEKGKYGLVIYNSDGITIKSGEITHDGLDNYLTIPLPAAISKGVYRLVLQRKYDFFKQAFVVQ